MQPVAVRNKQDPCARESEDREIGCSSDPNSFREFKMNPPSRICSNCGAAEPIGVGQPIWPPGWTCKACGHKSELRDGIPLLAPTLADTDVGMDTELFSHLSLWEADNFWFVPRNRMIVGLLKRFFPRAEAFLEIGCGTGFVLSSVADLKNWRCLVGSELHPSGLGIARKRLGHRAEFVQADARAIPARDAFDVVGAFDVLEHIDDDLGTLKSIYSALNGSGGLILTVPQHPWLWSTTDEAAHHVRRYERGELAEKVSSVGFRVVFSGSYSSLLLPIMIASRLWRRDKGELLRREFELPDRLNRLLMSVLNLEVSLTLAGVSFPAGGSSVVVAVKDSSG
jgi:SAM-dependent methyltransferase